MNLQTSAIDKINTLPENLLQEVNDFIDFLSLKYDAPVGKNINDNLAESDFSDYLQNLESYETALAQGKLNSDCCPRHPFQTVSRPYHHSSTFRLIQNVV